MRFYYKSDFSIQFIWKINYDTYKRDFFIKVIFQNKYFDISSLNFVLKIAIKISLIYTRFWSFAFMRKKSLLNISKIILQTFLKLDCILIYLCREFIEHELLFIRSST